MPHTYAQNIVHIVFSTKERRKVISSQLRPRLWSYIGGICKNSGIFVHAIGGMDDHIHLLVQIPADLALAKAVLTVKSNSSRWAHQQGQQVDWQTGYAAFSVSASNLAAVDRYICDQESHHQRRTFEDELLTLLKEHGIEFDPKFVFG